MTTEEKRHAIEAHCRGRECEDCKLHRLGLTRYMDEEMDCYDAVLAHRNYAILFEGKDPNEVKSRLDIINAAKDIVCGHREQDYGSPEDSFQAIADLWSAYLEEEVTALDVAMMMALLKIARIKTGTATNDSFVDLAGYAACGGEIASGVG